MLFTKVYIFQVDSVIFSHAIAKCPALRAYRHNWQWWTSKLYIKRLECRLFIVIQDPSLDQGLQGAPSNAGKAWKPNVQSAVLFTIWCSVVSLRYIKLYLWFVAIHFTSSYPFFFYYVIRRNWYLQIHYFWKYFMHINFQRFNFNSWKHSGIMLSLISWSHVSFQAI